MIRLQKAHRRDISRTHSLAKEQTSTAILPRGDDEIAPEACFRTPVPMSGFSQNSNCSKDYNSNLNAYLTHSFASKFRNNSTPNLNDCDLNLKRNFISNRMRNSAKNHVRNSVLQLRGRGTFRAVTEELFGGVKFYELKSIFALSYQKNFFNRLCSSKIPNDRPLAQKIWTDLIGPIKRKKFLACSEIALIYTL